MEEVDAEISEMKLFLNGRARFVAEGYLAQVGNSYFMVLIGIVYIACESICSSTSIMNMQYRPAPSLPLMLILLSKMYWASPITVHLTDLYTVLIY